MVDNRLGKIRKKLQEKKADATVLFSKADISYFTELYDIEGVLVITLDEARLFTTPLYEEKATSKLSEKVVATKEIMKEVVEYLKSNRVEKLALDFLETRMQQHKDLSEFHVVDFTHETKKLRMIKERQEINNIKRAAFIARNAFMKVYPYIKPGATEKEIADELCYQMRRMGAQREAFETIVATGANASNPHHVPTDTKIKDGDFLVIDFGAHIDGYNSDSTYTFLIGEKIDEKKELYNAVFYAQLFATEMIAPGRTKIKQIEQRAR